MDGLVRRLQQLGLTKSIRIVAKIMCQLIAANDETAHFVSTATDAMQLARLRIVEQSIVDTNEPPLSVLTLMIRLLCIRVLNHINRKRLVL